MTKKRTLADLFVVGKEVILDDGQGDPVTIWMQKLNPVEHEQAMRRAASARARILSGKNEAEIEMAHDEVAQLGREGWIDFLTSDVMSRKLGAIEAELAAEEEWSKDDYLQGLKDVWDASLENVHFEDPDDPDAKRVLDELERFRAQVEKAIEGQRQSIRKDFETKQDEDLERRVVDRLLVTRADVAWLQEFRKCEIWMSVRLPENHRKRYMTEREEVDGLTHEVLARLMSEYQALNVDPLEGKGSGVIPTSSPSSESLDEAATADSSGLATATE